MNLHTVLKLMFLLLRTDPVGNLHCFGRMFLYRKNESQAYNNLKPFDGTMGTGGGLDIYTSGCMS